MKYLFSFLAGSIVVVSLNSTSVARAEVRCDALFSNDIADVTLLATHLSPDSNRSWSPFRFHFFPSFFTIQVLGNFAESPEGATKFPVTTFPASNPNGISVHERNRLVAVLGGDPGVFAFTDGLLRKSDSWRRIDQAHGRTPDGYAFLVYEVPLTTTRPNYGYFKVYVTQGSLLRELGTLVPHIQGAPGPGKAVRIKYPNNINGIRLLSQTRVELTSDDGGVQDYEIEPPTPPSEQGLSLRGFQP